MESYNICRGCNLRIVAGIIIMLALLAGGARAETITVNTSSVANYTWIQNSIDNADFRDLYSNDGIQSADPLAYFKLTLGSGVKSNNDSIISGWYSMGQGYSLGIENINDTTNTVLGNLQYTLQADNISSVSYPEYANWNISFAKWIFPENFSLGGERWLTVDAGKKGHINEYLPMSIGRKLNNSFFKEDGYQLAEFNFTFDDMNFTPAGGNIQASERSSMNASLILDTFLTDAPLSEIRPFPMRNEHEIDFLFNTTKLKEKKTYNLSIIIRVDLKNNNSVLFKPYYGMWIIYNGTQAPDQFGNTATTPKEILPEGVHYASVSTNISNRWIITRYYTLSAGLNGMIQKQFIRDAKIEPNVSISPTNPAKASAFVGGENLSNVNFGIVDINNLLSDNMTLLGLDINNSGINGNYSASWYANSFSIKKGNSQEIVTTGIFNQSYWLDYYGVIGFFKKNDASDEVNAILWFNRTTGILSKISEYNDLFTLLSIENGLSTFKVTKFKFLLGWENPPSPVNGSTYTLYDVGNLNNPYLISTTVPNGLYRAFIHVSDKMGNNQGVFKDVITGGSATLTGSISYSNNATGIPGVIINLINSSGIVASTATGASGFYSFADIAAGSYYVNASKPMFFMNSTGIVMNGNAAANMILWLKGDLNNNGESADAGDLVLMKRASIGEIPSDFRYDLNNNGQFADAGDLVLMKRASIGEIVL